MHAVCSTAANTLLKGDKFTTCMPSAAVANRQASHKQTSAASKINKQASKQASVLDESSTSNL